MSSLVQRALFVSSLMTLILFQNCAGPMSTDCETEQCEQNLNPAAESDDFWNDSGYRLPIPMEAQVTTTVVVEALQVDLGIAQKALTLVDIQALLDSRLLAL